MWDQTEQYLDSLSKSDLTVYIGNDAGAEGLVLHTKIGRNCRNLYCEYVIKMARIRPTEAGKEYSLDLPEFNPEQDLLFINTQTPDAVSIRTFCQFLLYQTKFQNSYVF